MIKDADGDDADSNFEDPEVTSPSSSVTYRVIIDNDSAVPVTIISLSDDIYDPVTCLDSSLENVVGQTLAADDGDGGGPPNGGPDEIVCTFVETAPSSDGAIVIDTVTVTAQGSGTIQASDTATIKTPSKPIPCPPFEGGLSMGYWKTHTGLDSPDRDPTYDNLPIFLGILPDDGSPEELITTETAARDLFVEAETRDIAVDMLKAQLLAAKLNALKFPGFADVQFLSGTLLSTGEFVSTFGDAIAAGDQMLNDIATGQEISGSDVEAIKDLLEAANTGCPAPTPTPTPVTLAAVALPATGSDSGNGSSTPLKALIIAVIAALSVAAISLRLSARRHG
jgi:hypothetical protein